MASLSKNVASQHVTYCMITAATGAVSTSSSTSDITAYVTKDGTQGAAAGTFTSLGPGTGQWDYSPTQSETNATCVGIFITKTGCIAANLNFHTDVVDANGFKSVNTVDIAGTTVSTTTGQLAVNVVAINNVAATSVTAVNANIGQTQPVNFTGIGASALVKSDMVDIAGSAVSASAAQIGVNLVNIAGSAVNTASAQLGVNTVTNADKTGYALTSTGINDVADGFLNRDMSVGTDSGSTSVRTPRQAFRALRNKIDTSSGTLTVYKEDDITASWAGAVTVSTSASPIVTVDPTGP